MVRSHHHLLPIDLPRANVVTILEFPRNFHRKSQVFIITAKIPCACLLVPVLYSNAIECRNTAHLCFGVNMYIRPFDKIVWAWWACAGIHDGISRKMRKLHVHTYLTSNHVAHIQSGGTVQTSPSISFHALCDFVRLELIGCAPARECLLRKKPGYCRQNNWIASCFQGTDSSRCRQWSSPIDAPEQSPGLRCKRQSW